MNKMRLNLIQGGFQHQLGSAKYVNPQYVEWVKDLSAEVSVHIDHGIFNFNLPKIKYGWILEADIVIPQVIAEFTKYYDRISPHYEAIFTHDKRLLQLGDKMKFIINAVPWVVERKVYPKTKLVSMIASNKGYERQKWIKKFSSLVDMYGHGSNPINRKEDGLVNYMFSFAMENSVYDYNITEKITDCFATGTIPIYFGTPNIGKYFNTDGVIVLNDNFSLDMLTPELYASKMDAINDNFERTNKLLVPEDYMYLNYFNRHNSQINS